MPIRRDKRDGQLGRWYFKTVVHFPNGTTRRIRGTPGIAGPYHDLGQTKTGAIEAERRAIAQILSGKPAPALSKAKEVQTVAEFSATFLDVARLNNKHSSAEAKESIVRVHINPRIGSLRLDQVTYTVIENLKLALSKTGIGNGERKPSMKAKRTLSWKTINNVLTCLRRMLEVARKRGLIETVPEIDWLRGAKAEFDFLDFEEADRLVKAADGEWSTMIVVAVRTGMRLGELLGLRWQDVDLVAGRIVVEQNVVRGKFGSPKSGKSREIALGDEVLRVLKGHRHLRGPLVFCDAGGEVFTRTALKRPMMRACKRAGLRWVHWHVLRHTFASHLAMRGAPLKAIQELLGHATIQMTMRYAHLAPEVKRDAVRLLDHDSAEGWRGRQVAAEVESELK